MASNHSQVGHRKMASVPSLAHFHRLCDFPVCRLLRSMAGAYSWVRDDGFPPTRFTMLPPNKSRVKWAITNILVIYCYWELCYQGFWHWGSLGIIIMKRIGIHLTKIYENITGCEALLSFEKETQVVTESDLKAPLQGPCYPHLQGWSTDEKC